MSLVEQWWPRRLWRRARGYYAAEEISGAHPSTWARGCSCTAAVTCRWPAWVRYRSTARTVRTIHGRALLELAQVTPTTCTSWAAPSPTLSWIWWGQMGAGSTTTAFLRVRVGPTPY